MTTSNIVYAVIALVVIVLVLGVIAALKGRNGPKQPDFVAKPFLTPNELEFLQRLEAALPEMRIHAQVAMGALLAPAVRRGEDASKHSSARNRFAQKICDYVIQRRDTGKVAAIVELDDRTHRADKDAARDSMTDQAGYRTIRWQSKNKPSREEIRAKVMGASGRAPEVSVSKNDRLVAGRR